MKISPIEDALAAIKAGEFVLVADDVNRENEGDLVIAAEKVTADKIAFMVRHTSGLICLPMEGKRLDELRLPLMVLENTDSHKTAFTVSVDYLPATTTGISAGDRAATIRAMVDPKTKAEEISRPGHVFPLRYKEGGVLVRPGHTEAAVDLARLAGLYPAGVLCEIVNDDGGMAQGDDLAAFAARHKIPLVTIEDLVAYRWRTEALVTRKVESHLPTRHGDFAIYGYKSAVDDTEHVALIKGDVSGRSDVLVRLHSECLTGDVFGSQRCDCGEQLDEALARVSAEGSGVVVYHRGHEGRGIGLIKKLQAYHLQDQGMDTVEANLELGELADARHYGVGAQILHDLKVGSVRVLTNNPAKVEALKLFGVDVSERVPLQTDVRSTNAVYLRSKANLLGHILGVDEADETA